MAKVILFQGDSITDCGRARDNDVNTGNGYARLTEAELAFTYPEEYKFYNRGIGGNRIVDVYARIKKDIINLKPDYMSILIGINDVWHEKTYCNGVDAKKFEMIYDLMISEIKEALPDIKIMILEPFVLPGSATNNTEEIPDRWEYFERETALRCEVAKRIADKHECAFVPLQNLLSENDAKHPGIWLRDGVHPTAAGAHLIKNEWIRTFEKIK